MDLFDIYQQGQIRQAKEASSRAQTKAEKYSGDIEELRSRLDRLTLASQALWEILRDAGYCPEELLTRKMQEIDLRDGTRDGKISRVVKVCRRCQRNSNSKRLECLYCGEPLDNPNVFDAR